MITAILSVLAGIVALVGSILMTVVSIATPILLFIVLWRMVFGRKEE